MKPGQRKAPACAGACYFILLSSAAKIAPITWAFLSSSGLFFFFLWLLNVAFRNGCQAFIQAVNLSH